MDWTNRAACRLVDPDTMYPHPSEAGAESAAKAVCRSCPVRWQCLRYALRVDDRWGIWGGLTPGERARLRRENAWAQLVAA